MAKIDTTASYTLNELVPLIKRCLKKQRPLFLWSGPGIGKSSVIAQIAKLLGGISIDLRLSQMQQSDLIGIPYLNPTANNGAGAMRWAPDERMPTAEFAAEYPIVILFLDEMNSAAPAVQASAYQLVQDRAAGTYKLPDNVVIVAAGNRETDRGVTFRMPSPLANRFVHFQVKPDFDSWLDWALSENINPDVVAFLSTFKDKLYEFDPTSADKSFPTPRSWEFVSQLITTDKDEASLSDSVIRDLVASAVGSGTATSFMAYMKIGKTLPHPADILSGKVTEIKTTEISAHYQIIMSMLYELRNFWFDHSDGTGVMEKVADRQVEKRDWRTDKPYLKTWATMLENFNNFVLTQVKTEVGIMAVRMAFKNYNFMKSMPMTNLKSWTKIAEQWGKFIFSA